MTSTSLKKYPLVFLALFFGSWALAVETFEVPVPFLKVYTQPSVLSPLLTTLSKGQKIQAGSNPAGGFKKVLIVDKNGGKKIGYVALADLPSAHGGKTSAPREVQRRASRGLHNRWSVGLSGGMGYDSESSRAITDSNNNQATASNLTGTAPEFGASLMMPWSQRFNINFYGYYKSSTLNGTYAYTTNAGNSGTIQILQNFAVVGAEGRLYLSNYGKFWFGPGVQLDWGLSATTTLTVANIATTYTLSTNQFVLIYAATGYDIALTDKIYLVPEIRIGADVNAVPIIMEGDGIINFMYRF